MKGHRYHIYIYLFLSLISTISCQNTKEEKKQPPRVFLTAYTTDIWQKRIQNYKYHLALDTGAVGKTKVYTYSKTSNQESIGNEFEIIQKGDSVFYGKDYLFILDKNINCYNWNDRNDERNKYCLKQIINDYTDSFWKSKEIWEFWIYPELIYDADHYYLIKLFYDKKFSLIIREDYYKRLIPPPPVCICPEEYKTKIDTVLQSSSRITLDRSFKDIN